MAETSFIAKLINKITGKNEEVEQTSSSRTFDRFNGYGTTTKSGKEYTTPFDYSNAVEYAKWHNDIFSPEGAAYKLEQGQKQAEYDAQYAEEHKSERGKLSRILGMLGYNGLMEGLYNVTDDDENTTFLGGLKQGLVNWNPMSDEIDYHTGSDVLKNIGWEDEDPDHLSLSDVGRGVVGFAGDVLTDPLSYINPFSATGKVLKGSGYTASALKNAAEKNGLDTVRDGLRTLKNKEDNIQKLADLGYMSDAAYDNFRDAAAFNATHKYEGGYEGLIKDELKPFEEQMQLQKDLAFEQYSIGLKKLEYDVFDEYRRTLQKSGGVYDVDKYNELLHNAQQKAPFRTEYFNKLKEINEEFDINKQNLIDKYIERDAKELADEYTKRRLRISFDNSDKTGLVFGTYNLPFAKKADSYLSKTIISGEKLAQLGDNTISPYWNEFTRKLRLSNIGKNFSNSNKLESKVFEKIAKGDLEGAVDEGRLTDISKGAYRLQADAKAYKDANYLKETLSDKSLREVINEIEGGSMRAKALIEYARKNANQFSALTGRKLNIPDVEDLADMKITQELEDSWKEFQEAYNEALKVAEPHLFDIKDFQQNFVRIAGKADLDAFDPEDIEFVRTAGLMSNKGNALDVLRNFKSKDKVVNGIAKLILESGNETDAFKFLLERDLDYLRQAVTRDMPFPTRMKTDIDILKDIGKGLKTLKRYANKLGVALPEDASAQEIREILNKQTEIYKPVVNLQAQLGSLVRKFEKTGDYKYIEKINRTIARMEVETEKLGVKYSGDTRTINNYIKKIEEVLKRDNLNAVTPENVEHIRKQYEKEMEKFADEYLPKSFEQYYADKLKSQLDLKYTPLDVKQYHNVDVRFTDAILKWKKVTDILADERLQVLEDLEFLQRKHISELMGTRESDLKLFVNSLRSTMKTLTKFPELNLDFASSLQGTKNFIKTFQHLDRVTKNYTPEEIKAMEFFTNAMNNIAIEEKRLGELGSKPAAVYAHRYVPHFKEKLKDVGEELVNENPTGAFTPEYFHAPKDFDKERKKGTIKQLNEGIEKTYNADGISNVDELAPEIYNDKLHEIFLARTLLSNKLIYGTDSLRFIKNHFSEDYEVGGKLLENHRPAALYQDIEKVINKSVIDKIDNKRQEDYKVFARSLNKFIKNFVVEGNVNEKFIEEYSYLSHGRKKFSKKYFQNMINKKWKIDTIIRKTYEDFGETWNKIYNENNYKSMFESTREKLKSHIFPDEKRAKVYERNLVVQVLSDEQIRKLKKLSPGFEVRQYDMSILDRTNVMSRIQKQELTNSFLNFYDRMTNNWKIWNTLGSPSFHVKNAGSNAFQSFLAIGEDAYNLNKIHTAIKILQLKNPFDTIELGGKKYTHKELEYMAKKLGVVDESFSAYSFKLGAQSYTDNGLRSSALPSFKNDVDWFQPNVFNTVKQISTVVGTNIEGVQRMNLWLGELGRGKSFQEALDSVNKFLFDYGDLTEFESDVMQRIIPFYTFMRKNVPMELEAMLERPQTINNLEYAFNEIQDMDEDAVVPENQRNEWRQEHVQIPYSENLNASNTPLGVNLDLPYNQIERVLDPDKMIGSMSPLIRLLPELYAGQYAYTGMPIGGIGEYAANYYSPIGQLYRTMTADEDKKGDAKLSNISRFLGYPVDKINDVTENHYSYYL